MHFRGWETDEFIKVRTQLRRVLRDESGAAYAEYGIVIMAVIAVGGVVMSIYGAQIYGVFQSIGESMQSFSEDVTKGIK